jgi:hypothetical protein
MVVVLHTEFPIEAVLLIYIHDIEGTANSTRRTSSVAAPRGCPSVCGNGAVVIRQGAGTAIRLASSDPRVWYKRVHPDRPNLFGTIGEKLSIPLFRSALQNPVQ